MHWEQILADFMKAHSGKKVYIACKPFLSSIYDHSHPNSAWPHVKGKPYTPLVAFCFWEQSEHDKDWVKELSEVMTALRNVAIAEGITGDDAPMYPNLAPAETLIESIYQNNLQDLRKIRNNYDPADVMSCTGGFRIPL